MSKNMKLRHTMFLNIMLTLIFILSLTSKGLQQSIGKAIDIKPSEYSSIGKKIYQNNFLYEKSFCERHNCNLFPNVSYKYAEKSAISPAEGLLISKTCGPRHIVLTRRKTTGVHLWMFCCSLGMTPVSVTSAAEAKCLLDELSKNQDTLAWQNVTFLMNYYDQELQREFSSCPERRAVTADLWATAQPDNFANAQACVGLSLQTSKQTAGFDDINCMDKYYAMCQFKISRKSVPKYSDFLTSVVKSQKFERETCEASNCYNFPAKTYSYENLEQIPPNEGLLVTSCGKNDYLFSRAKMSSTLTWKFCCTRGMNVITIENKNILTCLYDAYKNSTDIFSSKDTKFWTSHYDHTLDRRFLSCPDYLEVPDDWWIPGEPSNTGGMQSVAAINLGVSRDNVGLDDISGLENLGVVCQEENEVRSLMKMSAEIAAKTSSQKTKTKTLHDPEEPTDNEILKSKFMTSKRVSNCKISLNQTELKNIAKALQLSLKNLKANRRKNN